MEINVGAISHEIIKTHSLNAKSSFWKSSQLYSFLFTFVFRRIPRLSFEMHFQKFSISKWHLVATFLVKILFVMQILLPLCKIRFSVVL